MIFVKNFARNYEKKSNTWNIRPLVDESFTPSTQRSSIEDCRISSTNSDGIPVKRAAGLAFWTQFLVST